jgi:hypothetical protein
VPGDETAGFAPPVTDKEIVVYRGGWGFSLPEQHSVRINQLDRRVSINTPQAGGIYRFERSEEVGDELRVFIGAGGPEMGHAVGLGVPTAYPFPSIGEELDRLRSRYEGAGGAPIHEPMNPGAAARQAFEGWAQGDDWDAKTTRMRAAIRELGRA